MKFFYTVLEGDNVRLDCAASGNPKPEIKWFRLNGFILRGTYKGNYNHFI